MQIGAEPLRNKNGYSPNSTRLFTFFRAAIFVINLCTYQNKSIFSKITAVIESRIDNAKDFA